MKLSACRFFFPPALLLAALLLAACGQKPAEKPVLRPVRDALGRELQLKMPVNKVLTMKAGALRLLCYMGVQDKVGYIEQNEQKRQVTYLMAHPQLRTLPVLGIGNNYDAEAVAASDAELVIATYMTAAEADALQEKVGKPVFVLTYGDMGDRLEELFGSFRALGALFDRQGRADSLIFFIEKNRQQLAAGSAGAATATAYVGGVAFNGAHGLRSSRVRYPPFLLAGVDSPVDGLPNSLQEMGDGQKNILIDPEQLIDWDTDFLFLDAAGRDLWAQELRQAAYRPLRALRQGQAYVLLPFNWHTINYEHVLCNAWFVAKVTNPRAFGEIDIEAKSREITTFFLGKDVYASIDSTYRPFRKTAGHD